MPNNHFLMDGNGETTIFHVKIWFVIQWIANHFKVDGHQVPGLQLCFMLILGESDANLTCEGVIVTENLQTSLVTTATIWNPKMQVWKMIFLFNWVSFRFHVI